MSATSEKNIAASQACASVVLQNQIGTNPGQAISISAKESSRYPAPEKLLPVPRPNRIKPQSREETEAERRARIAALTPTDEELAAAASPPPVEWYKEAW